MKSQKHGIMVANYYYTLPCEDMVRSDAESLFYPASAALNVLLISLHYMCKSLFILFIIFYNFNLLVEFLSVAP